MIRAAFFDIDGTLVSFAAHRMPDSTVEALARLRARGIHLVIASGRPSYQLDDCVGTGFDAYITLNGQLCYDETGLYRSCPIASDDVRVIVDHVVAGDFDAIALHADRGFASRMGPLVSEMCEQIGTPYEICDFRRALDAPVYQFCAFVAPGCEDRALAGTQNVAHTRWTHLFCDIVPRDGGKAAGVAATLERLGVEPADAVAFGDGGNDLSMFDAVGTSVAMGNAWDEVKARADHVTGSVDEDGILKAAEHLGLI